MGKISVKEEGGINVKVLFTLIAPGGFCCACEVFDISRNAHAHINLFHPFAPHERES